MRAAKGKFENWKKGIRGTMEWRMGTGFGGFDLGKLRGLGTSPPPTLRRNVDDEFLSNGGNREYGAISDTHDCNLT
jgi:hypothetical protein